MSPEELAVVQTLYTAERADAAAIFGVSIQLVSIMAAYAAVGFALLSSDLLRSTEWVRAFAGIPAWGLTCYVALVFAQMAVRVESVRGLENILRNIAPRDVRKRPLGSDAGDRVSNLRRQPWPLRLTTVISYLAALAGVIGLSAAAVVSVWGSLAAVVALVIYVCIALSVLATFVSVLTGRVQSAGKRSD